MDKEIRKVDDIRDDISKIDYQIAELFEKRMGFAAELALSKKAFGESIYNKNKEDEKMSDITKNRSNPFVVKGLEEIFIQMMSISRKYQYHMVHQRDRYIENYFTEVPELVMFPDTRVVYPGVPGSFSEMACEKFFGADVDHYAVVNFKDVAMALNNGDADYGVLPIENSSAGDVTGVYDILLENDVCMVGEVFVKVEHCLLGCPGSKIKDIELVLSHPQGLMQCTPYLEKLDVKKVSVENTAIAAERVAREKIMTQAAIASPYAAQCFGLQILKPHVFSSQQNSTRFIIVSKEEIYQEEAGKISVCFEIPHESGSLYNTLSHFIYNDLNMTKIESRPIPEKKWEYRFFVDFEGNLSDSGVKNALYGISREVNNLRILGNY